MSAWHGDLKPSQIDATQYTVYANGDEVARVMRREDVDTLDITELLKLD